MEAKKCLIFHKRLENIMKSNANLKLYKSGLTSMTALTEEEYESRLGYIRPNGIDELSDSDDIERHKRATSVNIPASIDWREKNVVTAVKNQGKIISNYVI